MIFLSGITALLFLIAGPKCKSNYFACKESMQCIHNDYLCDGRVHCMKAGEDEDFDLCKYRNVFAKGAMIPCIEKYRPNSLPIKILATHCDQHIECQNDTDEPSSCNPSSGKLQNKYNIYISYNFITLQDCLGILHILLSHSF